MCMLSPQSRILGQLSCQSTEERDVHPVLKLRMLQRTNKLPRSNSPSRPVFWAHRSPLFWALFQAHGQGGLPGQLLEEVFAGPLLQPLGAVSNQLPGNLRDEVRTLGIGHDRSVQGAPLDGRSFLGQSCQASLPAPGMAAVGWCTSWFRVAGLSSGYPP